MAEFDVSDAVVDVLYSDRDSGRVDRSEVGKKVALEVVSIDQRVEGVAVGVDRCDSNLAVLIFEVVGFVGGLGSARDSGIERPIDIVYFESDVSDEISV